jgi:hypothetical protein
MLNFIHISNKELIEFFEYKEQHPTLKKYDVYVDKPANKIFFVESELFELTHYDEMPNWKGQRNNLKVLDDYALDDSCKAINTMGLS